jgi:hypothetical protein
MSWRCSILSSLNLHDDEKDNQDPKNNEQRNDPSILPRILCSASLKGNQQANDCRHKHNRSHRIQLSNRVLESFAPPFISGALKKNTIPRNVAPPMGKLM